MRKIRRIDLRISEQEYELILQKMKQSKSTNLSAYMIKMAIDGMVINLNMPELKEVASLLRYNGNNINQIAKRLNESKSVYASDIEDIKEKQEQISDMVKKIFLSFQNYEFVAWIDILVSICKKEYNEHGKGVELYENII